MESPPEMGLDRMVLPRRRVCEDPGHVDDVELARGLATQNLRDQERMDFVSKWLIITRASVFPMTFFAAAIGGLLAMGTPGAEVNAGLWALCTLGLLLAHAVNNLVNDYFDTESGVDTPDYHRAQYSLHPLLSGLITKRGLLHRDRRLQPGRRRDRGDPHLGARLGRGGLRDRRLRDQHVLRGAAAPPEAHRAGRALGVRDLGSADDRRHLLRDHGRQPGVGLGGVAALRPVGHGPCCSASTSTSSRPTRARASTPCP